MDLSDLKEELLDAKEVVVPDWVHKSILQNALAGGVQFILRCNSNYDAAAISYKLKEQGYTIEFYSDNYGEWWKISGWDE